ncbi:MAG: hypothetical protein J6X28_02555 [Bacilli bacterium]|nr:hypothetical protein [Bacilli bacterium]
MRITKLQLERGLLITLAATCALALTGCSKKSNCKEKEYHVHRYVKGNLVQYLHREDLDYDGYHWTEGVYFTDPDFFEYMEQNKLLEVLANKEYIEQVQNSQSDYLEYEYQDKNTKGWTTDPTHPGLTGEVRNCHPMHFAYDVEKDENGNRKLVKSPLVENIIDVEEDYPMFTEDFTEIVRTEVKENTQDSQKGR